MSDYTGSTLVGVETIMIWCAGIMQLWRNENDVFKQLNWFLNEETAAMCESSPETFNFNSRGLQCPARFKVTHTVSQVYFCVSLFYSCLKPPRSPDNYNITPRFVISTLFTSALCLNVVCHVDSDPVSGWFLNDILSWHSRFAFLLTKFPKFRSNSTAWHTPDAEALCSRLACVHWQRMYFNTDVFLWEESWTHIDLFFHIFVFLCFQFCYFHLQLIFKRRILAQLTKSSHIIAYKTQFLNCVLWKSWPVW